MYIAYSGDKNYFPHIGVSLASLARYNRPSKVYLLTDEQSAAETKELSDYAEQMHIDLEIITVNLSSFKLRTSKKITLAAYYRLLLPDLLPTIDKIIYLDGDTIINNSLQPLWNMDLGDNYAAAVEDIPAKNSLKVNLFGKVKPYFNSGILLINLKTFRENNLTALMLDFAAQHKEKIVFHDQCVLNYFLQDKWLRLPAEYNLMACHLLKKEKYKDAIQNPVIIHYNSYYGKPWDYYCTHPLKDNYFEARKQTPWASMPLTRRERLNFYRRKIPALDMLLVLIRKILNKM
jgi:lipopolysaccharide biosynthesis glycosyltransferase